MKKDLILLSDEELRDIVLRKQLEYIKLCQDDFLTFVQEVWQDFIYRKTNKKDDWGHHQIIANDQKNQKKQKLTQF